MGSTLRRFNDDGIAAFRNVLTSAKTAGCRRIEMDIWSSNVSEEVTPRIPIDARPPGDQTRFETARYLAHKFDVYEIPEVGRDAGLWTWLAAHWYEALLKPGKSFGDPALYVWDPGNWQRRYRHLLAGPYMTYRLHEAAPESALCLLCGPLHTPGEVAEQLSARLGAVQSVRLIEAATRLYYDPAARANRKGAAGSGSGSSRRFAKAFFWQFALTYDLGGMSADAIIDLLPEEFDRFKKFVVRASGDAGASPAID